jgi:hypothetical protein
LDVKVQAFAKDLSLSDILTWRGTWVFKCVPGRSGSQADIPLAVQHVQGICHLLHLGSVH